MMMTNRKIGVLCGGLSAQREISQRSGEAVLRALAERGHDATPIFVDRDLDLVLPTPARGFCRRRWR